MSYVLGRCRDPGNLRTEARVLCFLKNVLGPRWFSLANGTKGSINKRTTPSQIQTSKTAICSSPVKVILEATQAFLGAEERVHFPVASFG